MKNVLKLFALAEDFQIIETGYGYEIFFKENYTGDKDIIARFYNDTKKVRYFMEGLYNNSYENEIINLERLDKLRKFCEYILKEETKNEDRI